MGLDYANIIKEYWGDVPDWVAALAEACKKSSQRKVARSLSYSQTTISQVLKNCYLGDLTSVEKDVRRKLMDEIYLVDIDPYFARVAVTVANAASLYINAIDNGEGDRLYGLLRHLEIAVMNYDGAVRHEKKKANGRFYD